MKSRIFVFLILVLTLSFSFSSNACTYLPEASDPRYAFKNSDIVFVGTVTKTNTANKIDVISEQVFKGKPPKKTSLLTDLIYFCDSIKFRKNKSYIFFIEKLKGGLYSVIPCSGVHSVNANDKTVKIFETMGSK